MKEGKVSKYNIKKQNQLDLLIDIIDNKLNRKQLIAKRDYFQNEINKDKLWNKQ